MPNPVDLARVALCALAFALAAPGCGGGDDDDDDDGSAGSAGSGYEPNEMGSGLPSRLPESAAECASATGSDGCFFDECCTELVACADNAACATAFTCYANCASSDPNCFGNCLGASFETGAEDFGAALGCALPAGATCGGSEPGPDGGNGMPPVNVGPLGSAEDDLGWDLLVSDDPLTAELEADDDRAVSEEVTIDGGTLTATAEDGTVFELTIPEGALYGPTVITLTPLLSLSVDALDGSAHGVQIEPDGLQLLASPTLSITPPDGDDWPVEQELPLAITGEDNVVSLALIDPASEPLQLALTHFSSYAVLFSEKGLDATLSQADIRNKFGGSVEERMQSAASERLANARMLALLSDSAVSILDLGFEQLIAEYEEHVVKLRVAKAGESCAAGKLALSTVLGLERQKQLLGWEGSMSWGSFLELMPIVAEVCIREEYEICRDEHVITRVLPALLGYMRQAELLGAGTEIDGVRIPPPWLTKAEDYVRKCLQFELQFDSNVAYALPDMSMHETVSARVPIGLQATLVTLPEEAIPPGAAPIGALIMGPPQPLQSSGYDVDTEERCRTIDAANGEDGELYVSFMGFVPGENSPQTPGGSAKIVDVGLSIALSPNLSSYDFTNQREEDSGCGSVSSTGTEVLSWSSTLGSYLLGVLANGDNGAWLDDWKPVNGDIMATKDLQLSDADDSSTSTGPVHLILFHTPQ